jgi:hypothetical protein
MADDDNLVPVDDTDDVEDEGIIVPLDKALKEEEDEELLDEDELPIDEDDEEEEDLFTEED